MIFKELTKHTLLATFCLSLMACGGSGGGSSAPDADGDGVPDASDMFPNDPKESQDSDADGVGDNADAFPQDATETKDSDADGVGDNTDVFPLDASETKDFDGNGVGDNADLDDDKDGTPDLNDAFPFDKTEWADVDGDKIGDNKDLDLTSTNPNSIQLDRLLETKRATKFVGGLSHNNDERYALIGDLVKSMGDINGDGLDDLFIGDHRYYIDNKAPGGGYILFGQEGGWPATVDLGDLSNVPHVFLKANETDSIWAEMGAGLAPLGDIDKDGFDDFMIAVSMLKNNDVTETLNGTVVLVFGRDTWLQDADENHIITAADLATFGVTFRSKLQTGLLGNTLENLGDLNNDGLPEVAISENRGGHYDPIYNYGRVHLMFNIGRYTQENIGESYNVEDIANGPNILNRVVLEGDTDSFGVGIQAMGDFNDDGFNDVIINDRRTDKDPDILLYGGLYVVFGKASNGWADTWNLDTMTQGEGIIFSNIGGEFDSRFGRDFHVSDLNADHIPDVLVSSTSDNDGGSRNNKSEFKVLWGGAKNWPARIASNNIGTEFGLTMFSEQEMVSLGATLEILPDTNNNGYPEILMATGDGQYNVFPYPAERVYKFDASLIKQDLTIGPSMFNQEQAELFTMSFAEEDDEFFLNTLSDMNGDGLSEFTFSASRHNTNGLTNNGEFYLVYGYEALYPQVFHVRDE